MGRFKVNSQVSDDYRDKVGQPSDLYRRFKSQFSILLNPDSTNRLFLEKVYVKNSVFHSELKEATQSFEDSYRCIIGLKGIGKTTFLKNFFNLNTYDSEKTNFESEILIKDDILLMIINAESTLLPETAQLHSGFLLGAVSDKLAKKFNITISDGELYDFISYNKPSLIQKSRINRNESESDILNNMFKFNRRGFFLETIKCQLLSEKCSIKKVIIILDNIEALTSWERNKEYVSEALIDFECLKNNIFKYCVKLIITSRPDTYYRLQREKTFNGYPHRNPLVYDTPVPIDEIFQMRFNAIMEKDGIGVTDIEEWKKAYCILSELSKELSSKNSNLIVSLWNYDIRNSVNHFERILTNREWFQNGMPLKSAFKIKKSYFNPDPTVVLKALLYGNGKRYIPHNDNPIVNYLTNYPEERYDLIPLYLIAYFENQKPKIEDDNYFKYIDTTELLNSVENFFKDSEIKNYFSQTINFYIDNKLLFVSPWDNGQKSKLAFTPRMNSLLALSKESTLLFEAFRDDLYLCESKYNDEYSQLLEDSQLFKNMRELLSDYISIEFENLKIVRDSRQLVKYKALFGGYPITKYVLGSFKDSIFGHYYKSSNSAKTEFYNLRKRIKQIEELLNE